MTRQQLEELERRAAQGDRESQYLAGCARHEDENRELRHLGRSLRWLRRASEQGDARADRRLGYIHIIELEDVEDGLEHYRRGAERGDAKSALSLGHLLTRPEHHFQNPVAAQRCFEQALEGGEPTAPLLLGLLLMRADFPGRDRFRAAELLEQSSAHAFFETLMRIDWEKKQGPLTPFALSLESVEGAPAFPFRPPTSRLLPGLKREQLERAAESGRSEAFHDLALLRLLEAEEGEPRERELAREEARVHYTRASGAGVAEASFALACLQMEEPGLGSLRVALGLLQKAADGGYVEAYRALGWIDLHLRLKVTPLE